MAIDRLAVTPAGDRTRLTGPQDLLAIALACDLRGRCGKSCRSKIDIESEGLGNSTLFHCEKAGAISQAKAMVKALSEELRGGVKLFRSLRDDGDIGVTPESSQIPGDGNPSLRSSPREGRKDLNQNHLSGDEPVTPECFSSTRCGLSVLIVIIQNGDKETSVREDLVHSSSDTLGWP